MFHYLQNKFCTQTVYNCTEIPTSYISIVIIINWILTHVGALDLVCWYVNHKNEDPHNNFHLFKIRVVRLWWIGNILAFWSENKI